MANRKATFAKRQREQTLKDKAREKKERRTARRSEVRVEKGPGIAWDQAFVPPGPDDPPPPPTDDSDAPAADDDTPSDTAD
jgi:hypothetical protein